jgi:hypothetical protein
MKTSFFLFLRDLFVLMEDIMDVYHNEPKTLQGLFCFEFIDNKIHNSLI